jgi:hypothetical protein
VRWLPVSLALVLVEDAKGRSPTLPDTDKVWARNIAPGAARTAAAGVALGRPGTPSPAGTVEDALREVVRDQAGIAYRKGKFAVVDTSSIAPLEWVVAHELGYLLGMCHVETKGRLMYPSTSGAGSKMGRDEVLWAHGLKTC